MPSSRSCRKTSVTSSRVWLSTADRTVLPSSTASSIRRASISNQVDTSSSRSAATRRQRAASGSRACPATSWGRPSMIWRGIRACSAPAVPRNWIAACGFARVGMHSRKRQKKLVRQLSEVTVNVSVSYTLIGTGWAECTVIIGKLQATITASYLSDALADLLGAVIRVVEGEAEATASFAEEPGEYRWRLIRIEPDRLLVRILEFPRLWGNRPDEEGKLVLHAECRLRTFARAILSTSQRVLEEYGIAGYREKWGLAFPQEKQVMLRKRLRDGAG